MRLIVLPRVKGLKAGRPLQLSGFYQKYEKLMELQKRLKDTRMVNDSKRFTRFDRFGYSCYSWFTRLFLSSPCPVLSTFNQNVRNQGPGTGVTSNR